MRRKMNQYLLSKVLFCDMEDLLKNVHSEL